MANWLVWAGSFVGVCVVWGVLWGFCCFGGDFRLTLGLGLSCLCVIGLGCEVWFSWIFALCVGLV